MQNREEQIKETIKKSTDRRFEIIESSEKLIIRFKKLDEKTDVELRAELEPLLIKAFNPKATLINFF